MLSNGDLVALSSCPSGGVFQTVGNLFVLAGLPAGWKPIVCVGDACGTSVCTTDGDLISGTGLGGAWHYNGNVFQLAGHPPATVAAFNLNSVATTDGDFLFKINGVWTFVGNIYGAPTPASRESWGALKIHYH
jgi:hypothetical protein